MTLYSNYNSQALYVRAAMKGFVKQSKESSPVTDGHKRYWHGFDAAGTRQTNTQIYPTRLASIIGEQICLLDAKKWNPVMKTPLWMDKWGGIATTYSQGNTYSGYIGLGWGGGEGGVGFNHCGFIVVSFLPVYVVTSM